MILENITFEFNDQEAMTIALDIPLEDIDYSFSAVMLFILQGHALSMGQDTIWYFLQSLSNLLSKAVDNKLSLHDSITQDIGYVYNEVLQRKKGHVYEQDRDGESWVGYRYYWCGVDYITWIYNNHKGEIVLEITPRFPGDPLYKWEQEPYSEEQTANMRAYEAWISNYQPFLTRTVARETASAWLIQANKILAIIKDNVARLEKESD